MNDYMNGHINDKQINEYMNGYINNSMTTWMNILIIAKWINEWMHE